VKQRGAPGPVLRMRVRRRGNRWTIDKQTRIDEMTLPRSSELPHGGGRPLAGFWYELTDADGSTLFRRVQPNPTGPSVEVPGPQGGLHRVDIERPEVVFDVLIPDLPEAAELRFFESEPRADDTAATIARSMEPVARIPLRRRQRRGR
jgi:hypothetical protein